MKIEPFKMSVTPEQSKRVQEIIFENGGKWRNGKTAVIRTDFPCLAFGLRCGSDGISGWSDPFAGSPTFSDAEVPEITYHEFINKYGKQMKNLKLEVGKTYLARHGGKVKIVGDNGHEMFPFEGDNCLSYTLDGHWDFERDTVFDLVAEAEAQPEKRTFKIPENTREISVSEMDGRIVIEFVPEAPELTERERMRAFFEGHWMTLPDNLISVIEQYIKEREAQQCK